VRFEYVLPDGTRADYAEKLHAGSVMRPTGGPIANVSGPAPQAGAVHALNSGLD
jgi:hypothetical protein